MSWEDIVKQDAKSLNEYQLKDREDLLDMLDNVLEKVLNNSELFDGDFLEEVMSLQSKAYEMQTDYYHTRGE